MRSLSLDREEQKKIAFFAALCLFMSAIEYAVPKPLPFLRLGISNMPVLLALSKLDGRGFALLVLLKVLGQGFISGTFFSYIFVFSFCASAASAIAMKLAFYLCVKGRPGAKPLLSHMGLSLTGAIASTAVQLSLSELFLFGAGTRYIAPLLWGSSLITSFSIGCISELFARTSRWYASLPDAGGST